VQLRVLTLPLDSTMHPLVQWLILRWLDDFQEHVTRENES
jgi:hypothetical protein